MTGFGRGISSSPTKKITVEIKSLNSKQMDLSMRVPQSLRDLEVEMRNEVGRRLERGKVDFNAQVENIGADAAPKLNAAALAQYRRQIGELSEELGVKEPEDWFAVLLRLPDVFKQEGSDLSEADGEAFREAVGKAVDALEEFRRSEGAKLYGFFKEKIANIGKLLEEVEPFEAERVPKIKARLEDGLARLTTIEIDRGRLEQEMIFYIEKLDITEEKTRLRAHLNYFLETLGDENTRPGQGQGKKLGFIAQEMGREINTLGSKSNQAEMQMIVVKMKDELEQIKEQVLNVL